MRPRQWVSGLERLNNYSRVGPAPGELLSLVWSTVWASGDLKAHQLFLGFSWC